MENMVSSSYPRAIASPCTTRLVAVPMRVTVPPMMATNERGIRYNETGSSAWSASDAKTGMNTITTAVLFRNGERSATSRQRTNMRVVLPPSGAVRAQRPIAATSPVLRSPSPSTSIAATVTVASLDRPESASRGPMIPPSNSTTGTDMDSWSSRMRSMAKNTRAAPATTSTNTMSKVMSFPQANCRATRRGSVNAIDTSGIPRFPLDRWDEGRDAPTGDAAGLHGRGLF